MRQIKICPYCSTEYFPHIEKCADCGEALLYPDEIDTIRQERKQHLEKDLANPVVVREADLKWIDELFNVLIDANIPCMVNSDAGCNKSCCGNKFRLIVSSGDADKANAVIEEYYTKIHPEIRESKDLLSQGKCPACSSPVDSNSVECPDCGLTLLIIE